MSDNSYLFCVDGVEEPYDEDEAYALVAGSYYHVADIMGLLEKGETIYLEEGCIKREVK